MHLSNRAFQARRSIRKTLGSCLIFTLLFWISEPDRLGASELNVRIEKRLFPGDDPEATFGNALALTDTIAVIGAPSDETDAGPDAGSVYTYFRDGTNWVQKARLSPNDVYPGDNFGAAVALSADTLVVGAPSDDSLGWQSGAVYVFSRSGDAWIQEARLYPDQVQSYSYFGSVISICGDTILIGKPSTNARVSEPEAYIFIRKEFTWEFQATLIPNDRLVPDHYGGAVGLSGNTAIVGPSLNGGAYIFVREGDQWHQQAELFEFDLAGVLQSVAIEGETALIGLTDHLTQSREVYIFARNGTNWTRQAKFAPPTGVEDSFFGYSIALFESKALISSSHSAANLIVREGTNWVYQGTISGEKSIPLALFDDTALIRNPSPFAAENAVDVVRLPSLLRLTLLNQGPSLFLNLVTDSNSLVSIESTSSPTGEWLSFRELRLTNGLQTIELPLNLREHTLFFRARFLSGQN